MCDGVGGFIVLEEESQYNALTLLVTQEFQKTRLSV